MAKQTISSTPKTVSFNNEDLRDLDLVIQKTYGVTIQDYIRESLSEKLERDMSGLESSSTRFRMEIAAKNMQNIRANSTYLVKLDDFLDDFILFLVEKVQISTSKNRIFERSGADRDVKSMLNQIQVNDIEIYKSIKKVIASCFKKKIYIKYFPD